MSAAGIEDAFGAARPFLEVSTTALLLTLSVAEHG